jgi:hypothetical protein
MSDEATSPPRRRAPFLPSLVAAVAVLAWIVVFAALFAAIGALPLFSGAASWTPDALLAILAPSTLVYVALAAAVLVSFWLIAPITGRLGLRAVLVRALIAAAVGVVVMAGIYFAVYSTIVAQAADQSAGGLYDLASVQPVPGPLDSLVRSVVGAVETTLTRLPLIALAALGSWAWQRRSIPHGQA